MNKNVKGFIAVFALTISLFSFPVKAETIYATSEDGKTNYTSIGDAWNAAKNGISIIMQADWNLSSRLVLDSNKKATIEMNGHKISRDLSSSKSDGNVIQLEKGSTLNLNGKKASKTDFKINAYSYDGTNFSKTISSGGLITGGSSTGGGGGIYMLHGSTLNLDTVAISGNRTDNTVFSGGHGGGVYMDGDHDTLNMNNAQISYNRCYKNGGGVYIDDNDSTINMTYSAIQYNTANYSSSTTNSDGNGGGVAINDENATISMSHSDIEYNYANYCGGGIYSDAKYTHITMNNYSELDSNESEDCGGGIYFNYSLFDVKSTSGEAYIRYNKSGSAGGGIFTNRCIVSSNSGTIDRINFVGNSADNSGGIRINQEDITVSNCTFKYNKANCASAIYVANDNFTLKNSSIFENTISKEASRYTEGAVDVSSYNDIKLEGTIKIENNKNNNTGTNVDLLLESDSLADAYILSAPSADSKIGLYIDGNNKVAKNQNSNAPNIYYVDNSSEYALRYDDSEKIVYAKKPDTSASAQVFSALDDSQALESNDAETNTDEQEGTEEAPIQSYKVTVHLMNSNGSWNEDEEYAFNENEPVEIKAPTVDGKTFIEYQNIPEGITVQNDTLTSDSISSDIEITAIYSDGDSSSTASIFGQGNMTILAYLCAGLIIIGFVVYVTHKKKSGRN